MSEPSKAAMERAKGHDRVANVAWAEWWRLSGGVMPGDVILLDGERARIVYLSRCHGRRCSTCDGLSMKCVHVQFARQTKSGGWRKAVDYRDGMTFDGLIAAREP